jgi:hypothetical protein
VVEHDAGAVSSGTLHPWGYGAMALAQLNSPSALKEFIPHGIEDAAVRESWCGGYVASAVGGGEKFFGFLCEPHDNYFVAGPDPSHAHAAYDNETCITDTNAATGESVDPGESKPITVGPPETTLPPREAGASISGKWAHEGHAPPDGYHPV